MWGYLCGMGDISRTIHSRNMSLWRNKVAHLTMQLFLEPCVTLLINLNHNKQVLKANKYHYL
jgi:hypothetical protein